MEQGSLDAQVDTAPLPKMFRVLREGKPRLGRLTFPGRTPISTPHYIVPTSRGVVPHITPDNFRVHTPIEAIHIALEDFVEKWPRKPPPVFELPLPLSNAVPDSNRSLPAPSRLRRFIALNESPVLVLGARRICPVAAARSNEDDAVWISTSVGFRKIGVGDYLYAVKRLRPDVVLGLPDIPEGWDKGETWSRKRGERMIDRTDAWIKELVEGLGRDEESEDRGGLGMAVWAPVLPVEIGSQTFYLDRVEDYGDKIQGLVHYDAQMAVEMPVALDRLIRYEIKAPSTPQGILKHLEYGIDLYSVPFIADATDAGVALQFVFGETRLEAEGAPLERQPLGIDLWSTDYALNNNPLLPGCKCYACATHHLAYLHHLLQAKEMLAWVLLQIHNVATMDNFFAAIRTSLENGTWEVDVRKFEERYERTMPVSVGKGPRVRGYQYKSEGPAEPPKNEKVFSPYARQAARLDDATAAGLAETAESAGIKEMAAMRSDELVEHGLAEKQQP